MDNLPCRTKCETCGETNDVNCFAKQRDTQLGVRRNCKMCWKKYIENKREKGNKK